VSGLIPLIKLILDAGVFSPVAPTTFRERFGKPTKLKGRDASKDTPAFGGLGFKKYF
jgi:hypothetical protein